MSVNVKSSNIRKFWSQPLRVECSERVQHITSRTAGSRLWFVNNFKLEERIQGFLGFYLEKYQVEIFAFKLMGNHYHLVARFPLENRAQFMRDFNARIAEAVRIIVPEYDHSGSFWQGRYACQALVTNEAVLEKFIYSALQPVASGLCPQVSWYSTVCFVQSALSDRPRTFKYFDYRAYNAARRKDKKVKKRSFYRYYKVGYTRLPGYENLSQLQYYKKILGLIEDKRKDVMANHSGTWMTRKQLRMVAPGVKPVKTKKRERQPLALGSCKEALKHWFEWYFSKVAQFREASAKFRRGILDTIFPSGTYHPPSIPLPA